MKANNLYEILTNPKIKPILYPLRIKLFLSVLFACISGVAMVLGFWSIVKLIANKHLYWLIVSVVLWFIGAVSTGLVSYISHSAEATFSITMRQLIIEHMVRLPASRLAIQDNNDLKKLIKEDIDSLHHLLAYLPNELVAFFIVPILSISLLLTMVGWQSLWVLLPAILASLYYLVIVPRVTARDGTARMQVMGDIITAVDDYTRGIRVHRIFNGWQGQSFALKNYDHATMTFSQNMVMWVSKVATMAGLAVSLLQAIATFAIAYVVAYDYDTSTLAATLFFSLAFVTPALKLGHGLDYVAAAKNSAQRLIHFLNQPILDMGKESVIGDLSKACKVHIVQGQLIFQDRILFENLSYQFVPRTMTAITAPSGTGKTMLLQVLAGFEPLTKGTVYINDYPLLTIDSQSRQEVILFIPQGGDIIPLTVKDNLKMVNDSVTDDMLTLALNRVRLDVQLDSPVHLLSGGERQRLCVAKTFLSNAHIILLDEPTSALDADNAHQLMNELRTHIITNNKTLIVVTHDKTIIASADNHINLGGYTPIKQNKKVIY